MNPGAGNTRHWSLVEMNGWPIVIECRCGDHWTGSSRPAYDVMYGELRNNPDYRWRWR